MSNNEAKKLLENIARLEFENIERNFELIAEDYPKIDVFIEYDDKAEVERVHENKGNLLICLKNEVNL